MGTACVSKPPASHFLQLALPASPVESNSALSAGLTKNKLEGGRTGGLCLRSLVNIWSLIIFNDMHLSPISQSNCLINCCYRDLVMLSFDDKPIFHIWCQQASSSNKWHMWLRNAVWSIKPLLHQSLHLLERLLQCCAFPWSYWNIQHPPPRFCFVSMNCIECKRSEKWNSPMSYWSLQDGHQDNSCIYLSLWWKKLEE